jgi:queuine tRNA-ribosyltransferase
LELAPEDSVRIQEQLGADIAMVLDHVVQLPASRSVVEDAAERTVRWAERCRKAHQRSDQIQFAIVQGGLDPDLRKLNAEQLVPLDFPGYAIGGLSVGEKPEEMYATIDVTAPVLPLDRPRYLMGVGRPEDLLESVMRGIDMFDCVMPTRNGRNAWAFTDEGSLKLRNSRFRTDPEPVQADVLSPWSHLSRAYLRHLFLAGEMLGPTLLSLHNLAYYQRLMRQAREAIANDCFMEFYSERFAGWQAGAASAVSDTNETE